MSRYVSIRNHLQRRLGTVELPPVIPQSNADPSDPAEEAVLMSSLTVLMGSTGTAFSSSDPGEASSELGGWEVLASELTFRPRTVWAWLLSSQVQQSGFPGDGASCATGMPRQRWAVELRYAGYVDPTALEDFLASETLRNVPDVAPALHALPDSVTYGYPTQANPQDGTRIEVQLEVLSPLLL